ncbi:acetate uptake transporter [Teredinibacter haidensis]|uniref:acetate uptake transporter n=1 Tax=Teredinibacter haidensis TaxID=2731755 RepID=UPI000AB4E919|nr:acetate uptake transporter [Teredinibacter haidensis]
MSMVSELVGNEIVKIKTSDSSANPAPLGLMGFGMTTVLLNLHNAGLFSLGSMILAMGIFYGGIAQVIAGIMEWKKGNTFATTAFISYGFFWMVLVGLILLPKLGLATAPETSGLVAWLVMWGIFTAIMFVGTLKINRALQFVFASLVVLFFLLAIGDYTGSTAIKTFAGYEGIVCGGSAIYAAAAQIINELHGRVLLPLGVVKS